MAYSLLRKPVRQYDTKVAAPSSRRTFPGSQDRELSHGLSSTVDGLRKREVRGDDLREREAASFARNVFAGRVEQELVSAPSSTTSVNIPGGTGRPLPAAIRDEFEPRLGVGLSDVRVHVDSTAKQLTAAFQANGLTYGRDIFISPKWWNPPSPTTTTLLAHELAHTIQGGDSLYLSRENEVDAPASVTTVKAAVDSGNDDTALAAAMELVDRAFAIAGGDVAGIEPDIGGLINWLEVMRTSAASRDARAVATFVYRRVTGQSAPQEAQFGDAPPRYYEFTTNASGHQGRSLVPSYVPAKGKAIAPQKPRGHQSVAGLSLEELRFLHFKDSFNAALASSSLASAGLKVEVFHDVNYINGIINGATDVFGNSFDDAQRAELSRLFGNASFHSVARTLNPAATAPDPSMAPDPSNPDPMRLASERYLGGSAGFMCNSYLTDFADLHPQGPYIPKQFWTRPEHIRDRYDAADEISLANPKNSVIGKGPPGLVDWFRNWGKLYGWVEITAKDNASLVRTAQDHANDGKFVVFATKTCTDEDAMGPCKAAGGTRGHSGIVAPEGTTKDQRFGSVDNSTPSGVRFVRSQAGGAQVTHGRTGVKVSGGKIVDVIPINVFVGHTETGFWFYDPGSDTSRGKPVVVGKTREMP